MEKLLKQGQPENLSQSDSDREELRSALNRMIEASAAWKRERANSWPLAICFGDS